MIDEAKLKSRMNRLRMLQQTMAYNKREVIELEDAKINNSILKYASLNSPSKRVGRRHHLQRKPPKKFSLTCKDILACCTRTKAQGPPTLSMAKDSHRR